MKTTHTPGPWTIGRSGSLKPDSVKKYKGVPVQEHDRVIGATKGVAHIYQGSGGVYSPEALAEQHANAALIAAAPDLLAACQGARVLFMPRDGLPPDIEAQFRRLVAKSPELAAINAAIAKAAP